MFLHMVEDDSFPFSMNLWRRSLTRLFDIIDDPDWEKPKKKDSEHNERGVVRPPVKRFEE
jgi:hypothetical protein